MSLLFVLSPRSPHFTLCDCIVWLYVNYNITVKPLFTNLDYLKSVNSDMLRRLWKKCSYRLQIVRGASGGHIEHL